MDTFYWRTLLAVAEAGSFSRAADRLRVTQSAVSRRVLQLEQHYQCELVDRSGPAVRLTAAGEVIAAKAREILALEAAIDRSIEPAKHNRLVAFACTSAFSIAHMPRILQSFMLGAEVSAQVACSVSTAKKIVQCLQDGSYDLAVIDHCPSLDLGSLERVRLPDNELVFVCSPDLQIPSGATTLRYLLPNTLVVRSNESCSRGILDTGLARLGISVNAFKKVIVVDDLNLTLRVLGEGGATTFISRDLLSKLTAEQPLTWHTVPDLIHSLARSVLIGSHWSGDTTCVRLRDIVVKSMTNTASVHAGV